MTEYHTHGIESLDQALGSIAIPVQKFIETGIHRDTAWDESIPKEYRQARWSAQKSGAALGYSFVRSICRKVARELGRPFIHTTVNMDEGRYARVGGRYQWIPREDPEFFYGYIEMPKRKYLAPLWSPLFLAAKPTRMYSSKPEGVTVGIIFSRSLFRFMVYDENLWAEYNELLDTDEMRAARRAPPRS